jgi:hypothetical protein
MKQWRSTTQGHALADEEIQETWVLECPFEQSCLASYSIISKGKEKKATILFELLYFMVSFLK